MSSALGITRPIADADLTAALAQAIGARRVVVASHDLAGLSASAELCQDWAAGGASVVDGETAPLLAIAQRDGFAVAAALVVEPAEGDLIGLAERAVRALEI
jgi:hypothetical protein